MRTSDTITVGKHYLQRTNSYSTIHVKRPGSTGEARKLEPNNLALALRVFKVFDIQAF